MKMPSAGGDHVRIGVGRAVGRVEGPAGIHAAGQHGEQGEQPADHQQVPAQQVDARETPGPCAPIIIGRKKLPSVAGIDGIRKKNTIITPCRVNSLL